jgi:hypothetical protein
MTAGESYPFQDRRLFTLGYSTEIRRLHRANGPDVTGPIRLYERQCPPCIDLHKIGALGSSALDVSTMTTPTNDDKRGTPRGPPSGGKPWPPPLIDVARSSVGESTRFAAT